MENMKDENTKIALFEGKEIRKVWHDNMWYFVVEDVVLILTASKDVKQYIKKMRIRDVELNKGWVQIVHTLLVNTKGGKQKMNCANTKGVLRIIQSISSPKAEPFKLWLAQIGYERIEEINNPELAMDRMKRLYEQKGYSEAWIEQRERGIITRHLLTDEWKTRGAKEGLEYAILTNEIYKEGFGLTARQYKNHKQIEKHNNLRDSMTNIELALTNLGEASAVELHNKNETQGFNDLRKDMNIAGKVTKVARKELEKNLNDTVVSKMNYKKLTSEKYIEKRTLIEIKENTNRK
jgi:hypothetical protein